jgi:hypothetical protein
LQLPFPAPPNGGNPSSVSSDNGRCRQTDLRAAKKFQLFFEEIAPRFFNPLMKPSTDTEILLFAKRRFEDERSSDFNSESLAHFEARARRRASARAPQF